MQGKQKSLLERVDALDEECEELQRQLGKKEERQNDLQNELQQMSEEKEQLQAQLTKQQVYRSPYSYYILSDLVAHAPFFFFKFPTGLAFRAPKGKADARKQHRQSEEQRG